MKKTLLLLITACSSFFAFAQQGYQWMPGTSLNSSPAVAGSAGSYTLTTLGAGTTNTINENVGLGTCATPIDVLEYPSDFGFTFSNSPLLATNTYTIEMVINLNSSGGGTWRRLAGFFDFSDPSSDFGIYVNNADEITFYGSSISSISSFPLAADTWYHLVFTRDLTTQVISTYLNGTLIDNSYVDAADDFTAQTGVDAITLLKDDGSSGFEEGPGKIAKIGIFDFELSPSQVTQRFNTICATGLITLPVTLTKFIAAKSNRGVDLTWSTATESNSRGFEIQRSSNGSNFVSIGFVNSIASSQNNNYSFTDANPIKGKNFYRLKQVDLDNRSTLSSTRMLDINKLKQDLQLYPNPSKKQITITNISAGSILSVVNSNGQPIITKKATAAQEDISIEKIPTGIYLLQVIDADGTKRTVRFSKM